MSIHSRFREFVRTLIYELFPEKSVQKRKNVEKKGPAEIHEFGDKGEELAIEYLKKVKRYKILAKKLRTRFGELDIIALDGECIVFIEVKTRKKGEPLNAVDQAKRQNVIKSAERYLDSRKLRNRPARFDVITILWPSGGSPELEHYINAFDADGN